MKKFLHLKDDHIVAGTHNDNELIGQPASAIKSEVIFRGTGSRVIFGENVHLNNTKITVFSDNSVITLGNHITLNECRLIACENAAITIKKDSEIIGKIRAEPDTKIQIDSVKCLAPVFIQAFEADISIGENCIFSDALIYSGEEAVLLDENSVRLNPSKPVTIGDQVSIEQEALILPGTVIGSRSVICPRSVVSGQIPEASVVAGHSAEITHENIRYTAEIDTIEINESLVQ